MPWPGPYTVLKAGDKNIRGYIAYVFKQNGGALQAYGDFPTYADNLQSGKFQFSDAGFNGGDQVLFDLAANASTGVTYATNLRRV